MSNSVRLKTDLSGLSVASFESRRAADIVRLIEKNGGIALSAPSMREIPLSDESGALAFGPQLFAGECDALILLTGVGTRILLDSLYSRYSVDEVRRQLSGVSLLCRGPKPAALLKKEGLSAKLVAAEPNTWRELLSALDNDYPVAGKRVFVQEYGAANQALLEGLAERNARVERVQVYRWDLPIDIGPLERIIQQIADGRVDCALFTSAHQVKNVLKCATSLGVHDRFKEVLCSSMVVASVGPVTTEALLAHDIEPDIEPEHPKMGPLVITLARGACAALARLRTSSEI